MIYHKISTILIWSENYQPLADWYQQTFKLKLVESLNHPQDTGCLFEFPDGGVWLWIGAHSQVKGQNLDEHRHMFNITVDSVTTAYNELSQLNIKFLATPFKAPTFDKYFATLYDPDGNLVQLIGDQ